MAKGKRKDYTKEYKMTAVMMMKSKVMKPKEIFKILGGIDRQTVYRWVSEYDKYGEKAFREEKAVLPARDMKEIQKENNILKEENEILKKAMTYFAKTKGTK